MPPFSPPQVSRHHLNSQGSLLSAQDILQVNAHLNALKSLQNSNAAPLSPKIPRGGPLGGIPLAETSLEEDKKQVVGLGLNYSIIQADNGRIFSLYQGKSRKLGQGGMGSVKLAQDVESLEWFAVKIGWVDNTRELEIMNMLGLVKGQAKVVGADPKQIKYYTFMDIVPGISLSDFFKRSLKDLTLSQKLYIATFITRSMEEAHTMGIVHRDIKPSNIMIDPRNFEIKLIDWGMSSPEESLSPNYDPPKGGTPLYISYQERSWQTATFGRDAYALGISLGELFTHDTDPIYRQAMAAKRAEFIDLYNDGRPAEDELDYGHFLLYRLRKQQAKLPVAERTEYESIIQLYVKLIANDPKSRPDVMQTMFELDGIRVARDLSQSLLDTLQKLSDMKMPKPQKQLIKGFETEFDHVLEAPQGAYRKAALLKLAQKVTHALNAMTKDFDLSELRHERKELNIALQYPGLKMSDYMLELSKRYNRELQPALAPKLSEAPQTSASVPTPAPVVTAPTPIKHESAKKTQVAPAPSASASASAAPKPRKTQIAPAPTELVQPQIKTIEIRPKFRK